MFNVAVAPATSLPELALMNFTTWVRELPATQMRPSDVTLRGLPPMVRFMPTQPPKSLRKLGPFKAYPVTKLLELPAGGVKLAEMVRCADITTVCGFALPARSPLQPANVLLPVATAVSWTVVPLS